MKGKKKIENRKTGINFFSIKKPHSKNEWGYYLMCFNYSETTSNGT